MCRGICICVQGSGTQEPEESHQEIPGSEPCMEKEDCCDLKRNYKKGTRWPTSRTSGNRESLGLLKATKLKFKPIEDDSLSDFSVLTIFGESLFILSNLE